jgi:hypothetical protein
MVVSGEIICKFFFVCREGMVSSIYDSYDTLIPLNSKLRHHGFRRATYFYR